MAERFMMKPPITSEKAAAEDGYEQVSVSDTPGPPDNDDEFIDPRLQDYPVTMVARTVHLRNDPRQVSPIHCIEPVSIH